MHSSRMRTAHSISHPGGSPPDTPPGAGTTWDQAHPPGRSPLNFPLGCGPRPDPPQLPPWVWAWTRSPSTSPLAVDLDQIPLHFPLGCGPGDPPPPRDLLQGLLGHHLQCMLGQHPLRPAARHAGIPPAMRAGKAPTPQWTEFLTHASENITLLQTSFAGDKNRAIHEFSCRLQLPPFTNPLHCFKLQI